MNPSNPKLGVNNFSDLAVQSTQSLNAGSPRMHIKVYSPYKIYFDDSQCQSISAKNKTGPFDILPHHHKFITLLDPCELVIHYNGGVQRIRISRGIMHVKSDRVIVFLDV